MNYNNYKLVGDISYIFTNSTDTTKLPNQISKHMKEFIETDEHVMIMKHICKSENRNIKNLFNMNIIYIVELKGQIHKTKYLNYNKLKSTQTLFI